jgi:hypothetical protein
MGEIFAHELLVISKGFSLFVLSSDFGRKVSQAVVDSPGIRVGLYVPCRNFSKLK